MSKMLEEEEFFLYKNIFSVRSWDGFQYYIVFVWVFRFQVVFFGIVFFVGMLFNSLVLVAILRYKKLRQFFNYILVNVFLGGFFVCIFFVFIVFINSCYGYFVFGFYVCVFESFLGIVVGIVGEGGWGEVKDIVLGLELGIRLLGQSRFLRRSLGERSLMFF